MSSSRKESERAKFVQDKCQTLLTLMLRDEDNKYCVDCDAKGILAANCISFLFTLKKYVCSIINYTYNDIINCVHDYVYEFVLMLNKSKSITINQMYDRVTDSLILF